MFAKWGISRRVHTYFEVKKMNTEKAFGGAMAALMVLSIVLVAPVAAQEKGRKTVSANMDFAHDTVTVKFATLPRGNYEFRITLMNVQSRRGETPDLDSVSLVNMDRNIGENVHTWQRPEQNITYRAENRIMRDNQDFGLKFNAERERIAGKKWTGNAQLYVEVLVEWRRAGLL
jgi:hypothetical protein